MSVVKTIRAVLERTGRFGRGVLVGADQFGNRYYEDNSKIFSANREVEFADNKNFNASQVPGEWHRWLTYATDTRPLEVSRYKWQIPHEENQTATENQYVPYSTVKPKVQAWKP